MASIVGATSVGTQSSWTVSLKACDSSARTLQSDKDVWIEHTILPLSQALHACAAMADGPTASLRDTDSPSPRSQSPAPSSKLSSKSHDSLASHPLLGDTAIEAEVPAATTAATTFAADSITSQPAPYAVSYRTRQRPLSAASLSQPSLGVYSQPSQAAAATTTSASATSPLPTSPGNPSSLTNKLHSQNLQASAQAAGLSSDSSGWHMLQKLVNAAEKENEKDKALITALKALRTGKASLQQPSVYQ